MSKPTLFAAVASAVIVTAGIFTSLSLRRTPQLNFTAVTTADITQAVNVDGAVDAAQDLSLSFQTGGTVTAINVKAGDTVKAGQTLVRLDTAPAAAALGQAKAALAQAEANYQKIRNGATGAQLDVTQAALATAQTALDNAKKTQTATIAQQNLIVSNAQNILLNSGLTASPGSGNLSAVSPTISGTYTGQNQGKYDIKIFNTGGGAEYSYTGLENGSNIVSSTGPTPLGSKGLFIQFPAGPVSSNDSWTVLIPNSKSSSYLTNSNNYNAALQTQNQSLVSAQAAVDNAQAAVVQAQQNLQLQQTPARPEDVQTAQAQVDAASALQQTAQNNLNNAVLTAPIDGIVTAVDVKIGETTQTGTFMPGVEVVKMISNQKLQIVAYLSEADIGKIKVGDPAQVTLDAYGSAAPFAASVLAIDPGATVQRGISTYKTTLEFVQSDDRIKTGMDANVVITDQTHRAALVIPKTAVIQKTNQALVLTDGGSGQIVPTEIQTGITGLDGNIEVISGLSAGQKVAAFGN